MDFLIHLHSGLRWIVFITLVWAILNAFFNKNNDYNTNGKKPSLFALIAVHTQLLIGLILYFISPKVVFSAESMKVTALRFYLIEHIALMLVAVVLITIGYSKAKRQENGYKSFRFIRIFYLIGLLLILLGIPWPWQDLGASWF